MEHTLFEGFDFEGIRGTSNVAIYLIDIFKQNHDFFEGINRKMDTGACKSKKQ